MIGFCVRCTLPVNFLVISSLLIFLWRRSLLWRIGVFCQDICCPMRAIYAQMCKPWERWLLSAKCTFYILLSRPEQFRLLQWLQQLVNSLCSFIGWPISVSSYIMHYNCHRLRRWFTRAANSWQSLFIWYLWRDVGAHEANGAVAMLIINGGEDITLSAGSFSSRNG